MLMAVGTNACSADYLVQRVFCGDARVKPTKMDAASPPNASRHPQLALFEFASCLLACMQVILLLHAGLRGVIGKQEVAQLGLRPWDKSRGAPRQSISSYSLKSGKILCPPLSRVYKVFSSFS
jgi:hypothetical protein